MIDFLYLGLLRQQPKSISDTPCGLSIFLSLGRLCNLQQDLRQNVRKEGPISRRLMTDDDEDPINAGQYFFHLAHEQTSKKLC